MRGTKQSTQPIRSVIGIDLGDRYSYLHELDMQTGETLNLLRKSSTEAKLNVMNTGDEVEAQVEAFTATAVTLTEDAEDLKTTDDLLDPQTEAGQGAVGLFVLVGERVTLAGFGRQTGMGVQLVQARIAEVGEHDSVGVNAGGALLKQAEVVRPAPTKSGCHHFAGFPVQKHLSF